MKRKFMNGFLPLVLAGAFSFSQQAHAGKKASDYFPTRMERIVVYELMDLLSDGDTMTLKQIFEDSKQEGATLTAVETIVIKHGDKVAMAKERGYLILEDRITRTWENVSKEGNTVKDKAPKVILLVPDGTGKAEWTYSSGGNTHTCVATFTKLKAGGRSYNDCILVEEKWSEGGKKNWVKNYYQKGVGLVRSEAYDEDGKMDRSRSIQLTEVME